MSLQAQGLGYVYPAGVRGFGPVDLQVGPGERVLVSGPSGSGKSSLARALVGLAQRHGGGRCEGAVTVVGLDPAQTPASRRAAQVGFVGQVPADQLVGGTVADEVELVLRWAGRPDPAGARAALDEIGLGALAARAPRALSGGQQQRLAVAAGLVGGAPLLVLDEPLAMLDPEGAGALLELLAKRAEAGVAVVLVEHRVRACRAWASREIRLEGGKILHDGPPLAAPAPPKRAAPAPVLGAEVARLRALSWAWDGVPALLGVDLSVRRGERVALIGPNGAGKSTLLDALAGRIGGQAPLARCVAVPQDPDLALYRGSVTDELMDGPIEAGADQAEARARALRLAEGFGLAPLADRPPQGLSRGERMRVAVAAALACAPELLLLDEPTAGQDEDHVAAVFDALDAHLGASALVFATHDLGLAARRATRVIRLHEGRVVADGTP